MFGNALQGIEYVNRNRIMFEAASYSANANLTADETCSVTSPNPMWFEPKQGVFDDVEEMASSISEGETYASLSSFDIPMKYNNPYGIACGVFSYATAGLWCRDYSPTNYPHDRGFWQMVNASLKNMMYSGNRSVNSLSTVLKTFPIKEDEEPDVSDEARAKIAFYSQSVMSAPNECYYIWDEYAKKYITLKPQWTGNKNCLPVGLVMNRDIVSYGGEPFNNFSIYGFLAVIPCYVGEGHLVRGMSLGKDVFVVGRGLKVEVVVAKITENRPYSDPVDTTFAFDSQVLTNPFCYLSQVNLCGHGSSSSSESSSSNSSSSSSKSSSSGKSSSSSVMPLLYSDLENLFSGGLSEHAGLFLSRDNDIINNYQAECVVIYHEVIDLRYVQNKDFIFYFDKPIEGSSNDIKQIVLGMRPYSINGDGNDYPPAENPYGTDEGYLGNYALIDISDKQFYWIS